MKNLNHENESDRWHWSIPWLRLHHCVLEEDALRACKDAHEWADYEGIDGRNSVSRNKTFFELRANKQNDTGFHPHSFVHLDLHVDSLVSHGLFETQEQSLP